MHCFSHSLLVSSVHLFDYHCCNLTGMSAFVYTIPIGIIQAITNQQIAVNVVTELIAGYVVPGKPVAMMMFKVGSHLTAYAFT